MTHENNQFSNKNCQINLNTKNANINYCQYIAQYVTLYNITSFVIDWSVVSPPPPSFPLLVGLRILRALATSLLFLPSLTPSSGVVLFIPPISTCKNDQLMQHNTMLMGGST